MRKYINDCMLRYPPSQFPLEFVQCVFEEATSREGKARKVSSRRHQGFGGASSAMPRCIRHPKKNRDACKRRKWPEPGPLALVGKSWCRCLGAASTPQGLPNPQEVPPRISTALSPVCSRNRAAIAFLGFRACVKASGQASTSNVMSTSGSPHGLTNDNYLPSIPEIQILILDHLIHMPQ